MLETSLRVRISALCLFLFIPALVFSQRQETFRGSIPEEVLRPSHGESPRYPADIVIGELGRGSASAGAYNFANSVASALLGRQTQNAALASINYNSRENYFSALNVINPLSFRIGGGREGADGSVSFLVRFIGREQGITGEMYIRYVTRQAEDYAGETVTAGNWILEELLLEEPRSREIENRESSNRNNLYSYERFF